MDPPPRRRLVRTLRHFTIPVYMLSAGWFICAYCNRKRSELCLDGNRICKRRTCWGCVGLPNRLFSQAMTARGRRLLGYPRMLSGLVVALVATSAALFLFFQANSQTFRSPLDTLSPQLDAGQDGPDVAEQPESAEPAPPSITI